MDHACMPWCFTISKRHLVNFDGFRIQFKMMDFAFKVVNFAFTMMGFVGASGCARSARAQRPDTMTRKTRGRRRGRGERKRR